MTTSKSAMSRPGKGKGRSAGAGNSSTRRSTRFIDKVHAEMGVRFVVVLRGGEEAGALIALKQAGFGNNRNEIVRRALLESARRLKKR